jgi:hypothetical protein
LPAGTYHVDKFYPNFTGLPPTFDSGDYMIQLSASENGKLLQSVKFFVNLINMVTGGGSKVIT